MPEGEIHVADIGTTLEFLIKDQDKKVKDISTATTKEVIFRSSNLTTVSTVTATFVTDGTDGLIKYITLIGTFNRPGKWKAQGRVVTPAGDWKSDIIEIEIFPNL